VAGVFAEVYGTRKRDSVGRRVRDALLATLTQAAVLAVLAGGGVVLSVRVSGVAWAVVAALLVVATLVAVFLPAYYLLPNADVTVREALPGAALAACAWGVSGVVVRIYLSLSESVQLYGVAGAALIVLTWLYVGSPATLVGVVLNAVLAGRIDVDYSWLPGDDRSDDGPDETPD
jgi:membrane protein